MHFVGTNPRDYGQFCEQCRSGYELNLINTGCEFKKYEVLCANEGEQCECPPGNLVFYGRVSTGFLDILTATAVINAKTDGTTLCNTETFGNDPALFFDKQCWCHYREPNPNFNRYYADNCLVKNCEACEFNNLNKCDICRAGFETNFL